VLKPVLNQANKHKLEKPGSCLREKFIEDDKTGLKVPVVLVLRVCAYQSPFAILFPEQLNLSLYSGGCL